MPTTFESQTEAVLTKLQHALAQAIDQLEPKIIRAADLDRRVRLGAKLSWSVFSAAHSKDAGTVASVLPGQRAMGRFFEAIQREGVPDAAVTHAREAFQEFEATVRAHAADRDTFCTMVSSLTPARTNLIDERLRKKLFETQSLFWGMRANAFSCCLIARPPTEETQDSAIVLGYSGLQQLHEAQPFPLLSVTPLLRRTSNEGDLELSPVAAEAVDTEKLGDPSFVPSQPGSYSPLTILTDYCSKPMPVFEESACGRTTLIRFNGLGRRYSVDLVMMQAIRKAIKSQKPRLRAAVLVTEPAETLYFNYLVPAGMSATHTARVNVYANRLGMEYTRKQAPEDVLPMHVTAEYAGRVGGESFSVDLPGGLSRSPLTVPEAPRYAEAVHRVINDLQWTDCAYDVYRCAVPYPVLHGLVEMLVDPTP